MKNEPGGGALASPVGVEHGQLLADAQAVFQLQVAIAEQQVGAPTPADRRVGIAGRAAALFASGEKDAQIGAGVGERGPRVDADASRDRPRKRHFFHILLVFENIIERPAEDGIAGRPIVKTDGGAAQGQVLALDADRAARVQPRSKLQTPAGLHLIENPVAPEEDDRPLPAEISRLRAAVRIGRLHAGHQRRRRHPLGPPRQRIDLDPVRRRGTGELATRSFARRRARPIALAPVHAATGLVAGHFRRVFRDAERLAKRLSRRRV